MVWKILSIFAAACLGASCYFAWSNQKDLAAERDRESNAKANLKAAQDVKKEGDEALIAKKAALEAVQKDLAAQKEETVKLGVQVQEKEVSHGIIKGNLEQIQQQVAAVEKQIEDAGDIEKLIAQVEKLKKDQAEAEAAVANQTQRLASAQEAYTNLVAITEKLRETEARGRRGVVDPAFTARISQYFPEWDFVILNKGNSGGVFANADLDVKRGKDVIARIKVKNVEQYGSIAELIPGSLATGQAIRTGDTVVASATQSAAAEKSTSSDKGAAPAASDATAPAAAPAAAPAMGADPFGAAPAAAPAMSSDPFGAAPAPAAAPAAAPAMGADPFGAAPTPAPGAAPAGTADKPNTADPFGAAPAPKP
jgi:hypothetical protein